MDLSLKQRLLGAIVLIALAVIFVPMLLSGPAPQQGSETVNLAIPPAPDREFQNRVLPVDPAQQAAKSDAPVTTSESLATVETPPRPAEIPQPTVATPPVPAAEPAKPPPRPAEIPQPTAATPRVPAADPEKPPTPASTQAETKAAEAEPGRAASGRFYVHLGVYAATKNADDLVAALKQGGFPAFAE